MANEIITKYQLDKRNYWIDEIRRLSGNFVVDAEKVEQEISEEIRCDGGFINRSLVGAIV